MKFDKFVKYAGSNGMICKDENGNSWLFFGSVGMMIPEGKNVCGTSATMPEFIDIALFDADFEPCELVSAFVPNPDSKPSELMRKFNSYDDIKIDIPNKIFGFIEKENPTYITGFTHDGVNYTALLVTDDYDEDPEFKMLYFVKG